MPETTDRKKGKQHARTLNRATTTQRERLSRTRLRRPHEMSITARDGSKVR